MIAVTTLDVLCDRFPAATTRDRQAAINEIESPGDGIVEDCMARMKPLYPNIPRFHVSGFDRGYRDNRLLLTYMAKAMYFDDLKLLDDQGLTWVRTLFKSFNFTPKFMRDNFTLLREAVRRRTKPRTFALLEPLLTHTLEYLSDIPEPVCPEL